MSIYLSIYPSISLSLSLSLSLYIYIYIYLSIHLHISLRTCGSPGTPFAALTPAGATPWRLATVHTHQHTAIF